MGMAGAIATRQDFLHWRGPVEPLNVLYIDGEMARDLIKDRLQDLSRRLGKQKPEEPARALPGGFPEHVRAEHASRTGFRAEQG